jgi:GPH family glycoside/pentoside/hexuronide:cation symporter
MGFNFYWTNIATFLLIFYTDVFGISAAAAATMMFRSRSSTPSPIR